jgi:hypothetical protein
MITRRHMPFAEDQNEHRVPDAEGTLAECGIPDLG